MNSGGNAILLQQKLPEKKRKWFHVWNAIDLNFGYAAIAAAFSWLFVNYFITIFGIDFWPDVRAYESNFRDSFYYYQALQIGPIEFFSKEILWLYVIRSIMDFNLTTVQALYIISLMSCSIISYFILINTRKFYSLVFLLNPIFVDFIIGQGRSSFAIALFFIALMVRSEVLRIVIILAASAIHFSVPLFAGFYYFFVLVTQFSATLRVNESKRTWFAIAFGVAFTFEFLRTLILSALNDTRAAAQLDQEPSLLLALGFFLFVVTYVVTSRNRKASFAYFFYTVNALLFLFATVAGVYASRYVAVGYALLCILQANQTRIGQIVMGGHMLAFSALYFVFWAN